MAGGRGGSARRGAATILEPGPGLPGTPACCPSVLAAPLGAEDAADLARTLGAVADPVRLQVLSILAAAPAGAVCVCDLVEPLGKSQPTVSHHLKVLGDAGLVHGERRGRWVWYSLDRERLAVLRVRSAPDGARRPALGRGSVRVPVPVLPGRCRCRCCRGGQR